MKSPALQRLQLLKDVLEEAIDRGVSSVQRIHETIADIPLDAMQRSGVLPPEALQLRERQRALIGMVYDTIRQVTRGVGDFVSDQIENLEEGAHVADLLIEEVQPAPPPAPAAASKHAAKVAAKRPRKPAVTPSKKAAKKAVAKLAKKAVPAKAKKSAPRKT